MNAQEKYNQLIENSITPFLEQQGFKKSSGIFYIDYPDFRTIIQIQKSRSNSQERISFTFNLGIFDKYIFRCINKTNLPKNLKPEDCILSKRIGRLHNDGLDKWYDLDSSIEIDNLFQKIKFDFEEFVFPWFNKVKEQNDFVNQYRTESDIYIKIKGLDLYTALHLLRLNMTKEAEQLFKSELNKLNHNSDAQNRVKAIARENGIIINS